MKIRTTNFSITDGDLDVLEESLELLYKLNRQALGYQSDGIDIGQNIDSLQAIINDIVDAFEDEE